MEFLKERLKLRIYQQTILNTALSHNTLCVIPTGLGKTYIAIALAGLLIKKPADKVLMVAPTKPLVNQHKKTFEEFFKQENLIVAVTGTTPSSKRKEIYRDAQIIIATPQTVKHDILAGRINLSDFRLVVFDEAHRAVGEYSYVSIAKYYSKIKGRIFALTASPGTDEEKVSEICKNLYISKIESRDKTHPEVSSFVMPLLTKYEFIELPPEFKKIKRYLELAIKERLLFLKRLGFVRVTEPRKFSKKTLLTIQAQLRARVKEGDFDVMRGLSLLAAIIKINHAINLLGSESISALCSYLDNIWEQGKTTKTKAVKNMITDFNIRVAYKLALEAKENQIEHPKLKYLRELFEKIISKKKTAKILVFTEFRSNINQILKELSDFAVEKFVGQASTVGKGMSQKEQIEKIQMLKNGEVNALICTSVAEEGLDIPSVDYVIFYTPVPSAIRTIQRRGRTGRQAVGNLVVFIAKETKDEAYFWAARRREKGMDAAIKTVSGQLTTSQELLATSYQPTADSRQLTAESSELKAVKIYIDNRERGFLVEELHDLGAKIELRNLEVGDFILSEDVVVEKKEVGDFVTSLLDRRLFTQAVEMKRNFDRPVIIVEGDVKDLFSYRNVEPNAIRSAIISLVLDYAIPFIFSSSPKETAEYLYRIAFREQVKLKKHISMRGSRRDWPIERQQQFLLEGLPLVGKNLAISLLKKFGSPQAIANASVKELQEVEKLGPKKAEIIKSVFDEKYVE